MIIEKCPTCGRKPTLKVGIGGLCFAECGEHLTTWPAPLVSGVEAVTKWNALVKAQEKRK